MALCAVEDTNLDKGPISGNGLSSAMSAAMLISPSSHISATAEHFFPLEAVLSLPVPSDVNAAAFQACFLIWLEHFPTTWHGSLRSERLMEGLKLLPYLETLRELLATSREVLHVGCRVLNNLMEPVSYTL